MVHGGGSRGSARATPNTGRSRSAASPPSNTTTTASRGSGGGTRSPNSTTRNNPTRANTVTTASPNRSAIGSGGGTRSSNAPTTSQTTRTTTRTQERSTRGTGTRPTARVNNTIPTHRTNYPSSDGRNTRRVVPDLDDPLQEPLIIQPRPELEEDTNCCHGFACLCCLSSITCLGCCLAPCLMAYHRTKATIPLLFVAAAIFGILTILSGYRQTWTLNAGENRQINTSWLTRKVDVQVITPHTTVEIDLYAIKGACPPLTGPLVVVHQEQEMTFGPGDYQYDYFFLNKGSRVEAGLTQLQGTQEVYMMRGQDKLAILQESHHDDPDWLDSLLLSARSKWTVRDYATQVLARFRADKNDLYTLLYDNPYNTDAHLLVDLWLDLTTYNLDQYSPVCGDLAFHYCAPIPNQFSHCMILDTSSAYGQGETVTIVISEYRDYFSILLIALMPVILVLAWKIYSCLRSLTRREEGETPLDPQMESTPQPSAPPATEDAIPIATAQVVVDEDDVQPIAAPTNEKN